MPSVSSARSGSRNAPRDDLDPNAHTPHVVIIGAGFGGLAVALELTRRGHENFTILERHDSVGGVWQANEYPGAACDVPSITYQFSFALNGNWKRRYGLQSEIREYLQNVARDFGLLEHARFATKVVSAIYDEATTTWQVTTEGGETLRADVLICAPGQLSEPAIPPIPGLDTFTGQHMHSAEWDHDVDLKNKRVAVVGGGASAIQLVPAIVDEVKHLTVVQRDPSWVVNKYDWSVGAVERAVMKIPGAGRLYHDAMWWWFEVRYPTVKSSSNGIRALWARALRRNIKRVVGDPQKAAAATPDYMFGCNRLLLSREWYPTLARDDVSVLGQAVTEMTPDGIRCADDSFVDADVVIWCTGFKASQYLSPIEIRGVDGQHMRDAWSGGPEAYLGMSAPGFPNMFMVYGPNTNSLTNSIVYLLERQASYIRQAVDHIGTTGGAVDIRRDVHDAFNRRLQQRMQHTSFAGGCPGWYTTETGKVTQVWVGSHVEYGARTKHFNPAKYTHLVATGDPAPTTPTTARH